ncbi:MAG: hypothetical protein U5K79_09440 [Cyclobacteriaceae bacterium]|nr:hypothetical protein [Cyclobacteriaceae bacterium]
MIKIRTALGSKYLLQVIVDLLMMGILIVNLSLILFDWIFTVRLVNELLQDYLPGFYNFYQVNIHEHFQTIDLVFVIIFLSEFVLSWAFSIIKGTYSKWFFYPFFYWYDLIGCIPIGSLRFLRVLRAFSILNRLQNIGVIDLRKTAVYSQFKKYYEIIMEEISDRVIINILTSVQDELTDGGEVMDRIIERVVKPRQEVITTWISRRIEHVLTKGVMSRRQEIHDYVNEVVNAGLQNNQDIRALSQVPVMGKIIAESIEKTISNVINNMIDTIIADLGSQKNKVLVHDISEVALEVLEYKDEDDNLNRLVTEVAIEVVEEVKKQVKVKKWLAREQAQKGLKESEMLGLELLLVDE